MATQFRSHHELQLSTSSTQNELAVIQIGQPEASARTGGFVRIENGNGQVDQPSISPKPHYLQKLWQSTFAVDFPGVFSA